MRHAGTRSDRPRPIHWNEATGTRRPVRDDRYEATGTGPPKRRLGIRQTGTRCDSNQTPRSSPGSPPRRRSFATSNHIVLRGEPRIKTAKPARRHRVHRSQAVFEPCLSSMADMRHTWTAPMPFFSSHYGSEGGSGQGRKMISPVSLSRKRPISPCAG